MPPVLRPLLILLVGLAAFSNSLGNPLLLDDFETIVDNQQIRRLGSRDVLMPERELPMAGRPLSNLSFALNYAVAGEAVRTYHATNLVLHLLCALAAFLLIEQLLRLKSIPAPVREHSSDLALASALLWVAHPLNSEVVNYLTQRTESLMALFYLLALYASVRAIGSQGRRWQILAVLSCALGALCKESIATAPIAVIALDRLLVFPSWRDAWQRRRGLYAGLALSWIVLAALQSTNPRPYSTGFSTGVSAWTYLLNQAVMIVRYLLLTFWPRDLVVVYGSPAPLTLGAVIPQGLAIVALLAATVLAFRRWPAICAAGVWFFLTLAPTSSVLPIATEVGAERRMYLPLLAVTVLFACGLWRIARNAVTTASVTAILVLALGAATLARNREYSDPFRLAELTVARWPTGMTRLLYAEELLKVGRQDEGMEQLRAASASAPRAHFRLGLELYNAGQLDEAITEMRTFVRLEPTYRLVPEALALAARALARQERWAEATQAAQDALSKTPGIPDAELVMAESFFRASRFADAVAHYRRYLSARPAESEVATNLAISLTANGQIDEGVMMFRRVVDSAPDSGQARRNLAQALLDAGRPAESAVEARRAVALLPADAQAHALLGLSLARTGQPDAAAAEFERALALDPNNSDASGYLAQLRGR